MAWPQQHASPPAPTGWPPQRSDQPSGWPPEEDGAASSLDDHGSDDGEELVFNDEGLPTHFISGVERFAQDPGKPDNDQFSFTLVQRVDLSDD